LNQKFPSYSTTDRRVSRPTPARQIGLDERGHQFLVRTAHRRPQVSRVELGDHGSAITVVSIGVPAGGQEMAPAQQFGSE
jgi:hypothetical protein